MRAKKHLGQNFLKSPHVVGRMVASACIGPEDTVVEVGPGKGVLTEALLQTGATVIAFEKDADLIEQLAERFEQEIASKQLTLILEDVLLRPLEDPVLPTQYKVVANIPYYITGELLRFFLSSQHQPTSMTLMVQKEVAERIVARDGKESVLSLSVKVYGEPRYIENVPARYFTPTPKVDSAIIHINTNTTRLTTLEETTFFLIVKKAFLHKRKLLKQNLKEEVSLIELECCGVSLTARAEDLNLEQWLCMVKQIQKKEGV